MLRFQNERYQNYSASIMLYWITDIAALSSKILFKSGSLWFSVESFVLPILLVTWNWCEDTTKTSWTATADSRRHCNLHQLRFFAGENPDCQSMLNITTARLFWRGLLYVVAGTVEIKSVHTKQKVAMLEHYKAIL